MNSFLMLNILALVMDGVVFIYTGLFILKKFKNDLEEMSFGLILMIVGAAFFLMGLRHLLFSFNIIKRETVYYFYLVMLAIAFLSFGPANFYLFSKAFNPKMAKIGGIFGILTSFSLLISLVQRAEEVTFTSVTWGMVFSFPPFVRIELLLTISWLVLILLYDVVKRFYSWLKTKKTSYKFITSLICLIFGILAPFLYIYPMGAGAVWRSVLFNILFIAMGLTFYFIYSSELIKREI